MYKIQLPTDDHGIGDCILIINSRVIISLIEVLIDMKDIHYLKVEPRALHGRGILVLVIRG